jgi:hypothetical protein
MNILLSTGKFLLRGLRNSAFFTTPLPPADQIREILLGARERLAPALVPGSREQTGASRLTPAQQRIWEELVASLTGRE